MMKNKQLSKKAGAKIPTGGSSTMMHRQASGPQKPGVSSQEHSGTKSKGPVRGGTTKMAGKTGVKAVKPA
jgi:hypothetical protein